ncbi:DegT/DnrJ/EryC1/StrS family aminotransferase [Aureimonas leprariae]|uniref:DegT/DnrJ/EryC1/StrS aminotransferase family protein n=1 Tax=Plantimonas leprariae TaxID=2615207 RepID=A0A7V7PLW9_9HYPH|nr:DegT/DnrJ/EryC1/StrS aminotransferase family protein [Aureimonas leprariae]KAB0677686.1 DegT/DnrJ/EryC1/StrS aminotransferase family protein [Aureimonas leprariae]
MRPPIEFIDLKAQQHRLAGAVQKAALAAIESAQYILGPQVTEFEEKLAAFCGARHVIGTANGTDAIGICLMTLGVRPGDAIICPAFTFAATAEAVAWLGATPIFVDIDEDSFNLDPAQLPIALDTAKRAGLKPRAVIAVDLFGQPADYDAIENFCRNEKLALICDSAQGFGATYKGRRTGQIGDFTTASFFPAKPLGCYGDGGAIVTNSDESAEIIRSLRFHGKGDDKYEHVRIGMNSRLDTIQAAILIEKLAIFEDEIAARQAVANRYDAGLHDVVKTPSVMPDCRSVWAQYTLRVDPRRRSALMAELKSKGIPTAVYYPKPLNEQEAYRRFPVAGNGLPTSTQAASEVLSLPMHPYLDADTQDYIIESVREALLGRQSIAV